MKPFYANASDLPSLSPRTLARNRTTHTRHKQLLRAANRPSDSPPPRPGADECCGSHCSPCVKDLWKEEVGVWRERWWGDSNGGPAELEAGGKNGSSEARKEEGGPDIEVEGSVMSDPVREQEKTIPGAFSLEW